MAKNGQVQWQSMQELGEHTFLALVAGDPRGIVFLVDHRWVAFVEGTERQLCRSCEAAKKAAERMLKS